MLILFIIYNIINIILKEINIIKMEENKLSSASENINKPS